MNETRSRSVNNKLTRKINEKLLLMETRNGTYNSNLSSLLTTSLSFLQTNNARDLLDIKEWDKLIADIHAGYTIEGADRDPLSETSQVKILTTFDIEDDSNCSLLSSTKTINALKESITSLPYILSDSIDEVNLLLGEIGAARRKSYYNKSLINAMIEQEADNVIRSGILNRNDLRLAKKIAKRKVKQDMIDRAALMNETLFNEFEFNMLSDKFTYHCDKDKMIDREIFSLILFEFLKDNLEKSGTNSLTLAKLSKEEAQIQLDHAFDVFDTDGSGSIDFREFILGCSTSLKGTIEQKIRALFDIYDVKGTGQISINELINLLSDGHQELWELVAFAEDFFARADVDGSNEIELDEFKSTVEKEPMLLEVFTKCVPSPMNLNFQERNTLREFSTRIKLNWSLLKDIWISLVSIVINNGMIEEVDVTTPIIVKGTEFAHIMIKFMNPPQMEDSQFVHQIFQTFRSSNMIASDKTKGEVYITSKEKGTKGTLQQQQIIDSTVYIEDDVDCREFIGALASTLSTAFVSTEETNNKYDFYFRMFDINGDGSLSRDEVYNLLSTKQHDLAQRINKVQDILAALDYDGKGFITYEGYVKAAKTHSILLSCFDLLRG